MSFSVFLITFKNPFFKKEKKKNTRALSPLPFRCLDILILHKVPLIPCDNRDIDLLCPREDYAVHLASASLSFN